MKLLLLLLSMSVLNLWSGERKMTIKHKYINFPVSQSEERKPMEIIGDPYNTIPIDIRLTAKTPDYWVFRDMSSIKGKTITIKFEGNDSALNAIVQSDEIISKEPIYEEKYRPQLSFTTKIGWNNDPNGMVYHDGEYHLYYQHNPYERYWSNMHWGHAVSRDLIHWEELPLALFHDKLGMMYSGSAVVDYNNTAGFNKRDKPAIIAVYTAASNNQTQCIAYSNDKGRTFTKYDNNPVIDSGDKWDDQNTRDPKVFWYQPLKHWVMVVNERDGHSIYSSKDLKDWKYESHNEVFWECPELFELAVDGDVNNKKWVMYGASGTYMIGSFDGRKFTPESGKFYYQKGKIYAAQIFNDTPDGRHIQIGWAPIDHPGMPFNSMMTLPAELTLRTTPNGVRLFSKPINEVETLKYDTKSFSSLSAAEANEILKSYNTDEPLYIKFTIEPHTATNAALTINGHDLLSFDYNYNNINGVFYSPQKFDSKAITAEVYIDRTAVQSFIDDGGLSLTIQRDVLNENKDAGLLFTGHKVKITNLEISPMRSIWKK